MSEIIQAPAIAKIVGCPVHQVRYNIKNGYWKFARVTKTGQAKHRYGAFLQTIWITVCIPVSTGWKDIIFSRTRQTREICAKIMVLLLR